MYKLYWVELRQKQADDRPIKRRRFEVMPPLRRQNTIAQIANAAGGLWGGMWNDLLERTSKCFERPLKFCNLFSTHIGFMSDGTARLQKAQFISKFTTVGNISSTSAKCNQFNLCR